MLIKSLQIGLMGFFICAANAWAGSASIQGIVKDAQGKPIKSASVRIESRDGKQVFNTVKTDAQGRYISQGLQPGVYRVSLVVNGAVKSSISNTKARADQATELNFDLKPATAATAGQAATTQQKKTHKVWVPAGTGSHVGGRWVEVPDGGSEPGTLNVKRASGDQLRREMLQSGNPNTGN